MTQETATADASAVADAHPQQQNENTKKKSRRSKKPAALPPRQLAAAQSAANCRIWDRRVFQRQQILFEGAASAEDLQDACKFFTPEKYDEVVQERFASLVCGYPVCDRSLSASAHASKIRYRISRTKRRVYDISDLKMFCSQECMVASKYLASQLSSDPVYLRNIPNMIPVEILPPRTSIQESIHQRNNDQKPSQRQIAPNQDQLHSYIDSLITSFQRHGIHSDVTIMRDSASALVVRERNPDADASSNAPPTADVNTSIGGDIEGYTPRYDLAADRAKRAARAEARAAKIASELASSLGTDVIFEKPAEAPSISLLQPDDDHHTETHHKADAASEPIDTSATAENSIDTKLDAKPKRRIKQQLRFADPIERPHKYLRETSSKPTVQAPRSIDLVGAKPRLRVARISKINSGSLESATSSASNKTKQPLTNHKNQEITTVESSDDIDSGSELSLFEDIDPNASDANDMSDNENWWRPSSKPVKPVLSLFGRMWTILNHISTTNTRLFLERRCQVYTDQNDQHDDAIDKTKNGDCDDTSMFLLSGNIDLVTRRSIFSERIVQTLRMIRQKHKLEWEIESDMLNLVGTLALADDTTVLSLMEQWVICTIFLRLLWDAQVQDTNRPVIDWTEMLKVADMDESEFSALVDVVKCD